MNLCLDLCYNHKGKLEIALEMIRQAVIYGEVKLIKFQKMSPKDLLTDEQYNANYSANYNSYGKLYGEHREYLELSIDDHIKLKDYIESLGAEYYTSVCDLKSAKQIVTYLNPKKIKIPSICNQNFKMLKWICENFKGEIHLSLGMTTYSEVEDIINFFIKNNRNKDLVIYACSSVYPSLPEDTTILEIPRLISKYGEDVKAIGFSGHYVGVDLDLIATCFGAQYIERHFTLNKNWKGTDNQISVDLNDVVEIQRKLKIFRKCLTNRDENSILKKEILHKNKMQRKSKDE